MEENLFNRILKFYFASVDTKNPDLIIPEITVGNISNIVDYTYNGREFSKEAFIIFSDRDLNIEDRINVVTSKPKYEMYYFIFDVLVTKYFRLSEHVFLRDENTFREDVEYKNDLILGYNNTIGSRPFSYYMRDGIKRRVVSLGKVVIENQVEIGSNNVIDSGIFSDTLISKGTKIDSNTYIAHDVCIGENTIITSGVSIGGFTVIGRNCYLGLNSTIRNGITIGNNVKVGMGAVVTKDLPDNVIVVGNPAKVI